MIVVDTSVALKWFVAEEGTPEALSLLAGANHLIAPELVIGEMCNAAWRYVRQDHFFQDVSARASVKA